MSYLLHHHSTDSVHNTKPYPTPHLHPLNTAGKMHLLLYKTNWGSDLTVPSAVAGTAVVVAGTADSAAAGTAGVEVGQGSAAQVPQA